MHKHTQYLTILFSIASFLAGYTHESYAARFGGVRSVKPTVPLLTAVANAGLSVVVSHINTGSDLNVTDELGNTALILAAKLRKPKILKALAESGKVNLLAKNKQGEDALSIAARMGNEEFVHLLIEQISRKHPEKIADGSLEQARQTFIAAKAQPLLSVVTKGVAVAGSLVTLAGFVGLIWYQKQKINFSKEHTA